MAQGSVREIARLCALTALIALGDCAEPQKPPPPAAAPPRPVAEAPPPPTQPADTCGAIALQSLIGRPRTEIPVPVNPAMRRVVCSTCVMTQDYIAGRQTIMFDSQTGLVISARCG